MNKRLIYMIIALLLGLISVFMILSTVKDKEEKLKKALQEKGVQGVVAAKVNIPKETTIEPEMIVLVRTPPDKVSPDALADPAAVLGKKAKLDIYRSQMITSSMIYTVGVTERLSVEVPLGKRAFTIAVDKISSINGRIANGDHIDMVGIFPVGEGQNALVPMFEDILVLSIGGKRTEDGGVDISTLTLALEPEQAGLLTYGLEIGKIKIFLRPYQDSTKYFKKEAITYDVLLQKLLDLRRMAPQSPQETPPPAPEASQSPSSSVDVYRGSTKSSMEISR